MAMPLFASASEVSFSLQQLLGRVSAQHPGLRAARLAIEEARGRAAASGRRSNPELGFEFKHDDRFREGVVGLSFDQKFPLTARLRLERQVTALEVEAAQLEVAEQQRAFTEQAMLLAVKLLSLDQQRALRKQQVALAQKLADFAAKRAESGEMSALDAAQAQIDAQRAILDERLLDVERTSLLGDLRPLLGIPASDSVVLSGGLPKVVMPVTMAWNKRPDYQLAQLKERLAISRIDLARAGKWQDVTAGIFMEGERAEDEPGGLRRTPFAGLRLSVPLPIWNKNEGALLEASASAKRATLETQALAQRIAQEIASAREQMAAQLKLAEDTRTKLLPLVVQQTENLQKAFEQGQSDLIALLRAREQALQLEAAVIAATREFHLARVRYESANGFNL